MLFILRTSKTHWKDVRPQTVKISSSRNHQKKHCPYKLIREYVKVRKVFLSKDEPFFVFKNRIAVKPANIESVLRKMLKKLKLEANNYNVHSFRSRRAVDLLRNQKISIPLLKKIGRWKSNIVYSYLMD